MTPMTSFTWRSHSIILHLHGCPRDPWVSMLSEAGRGPRRRVRRNGGTYMERAPRRNMLGSPMVTPGKVLGSPIVLLTCWRFRPKKVGGEQKRLFQEGSTRRRGSFGKASLSNHIKSGLSSFIEFYSGWLCMCGPIMD